MRKILTSADITLLAFLLLATVLAFPMASMAGGESDGTATIMGPAGRRVVDLSSPDRYVIEGREGIVVFEVQDGELLCVDSSCEAQICVKQHKVRPGRPVVCAPNAVTAMLTLSGQTAPEGGELDAVSR